MRLQPFAHLRVFVGGVVINDCMDMLAGRHSCFDRVEEADILLVPVLLHAAANNFAVEANIAAAERFSAMEAAYSSSR